MRKKKDCGFVDCVAGWDITKYINLFGKDHFIGGYVKQRNRTTAGYNNILKHKDDATVPTVQENIFIRQWHGFPTSLKKKKVMI